MQHRYLLALALLTACGTDGPGEPTDQLAAGVYYGDLVVMNSANQGASVFAAAEVMIDHDGDVSGSLTTESPTIIVGDQGTLTGTVESVESYMIRLDLTAEFAQSGTYSLKGQTTFAAGQRSISTKLVTRDGGGAVIGMTTVVWQQE